MNTQEISSDESFTVDFTCSEPAFALLSGRHMQSSDDSVQYTRVNFPILKLPITFGRTRNAEEGPSSEGQNFLSLGNCKALSRNHASIYFRDARGGRLDQVSSGAFEYKKNNNAQQRPLIHDETTPIPDHGFFVIECLGKNKLFVDKQRVEQGQVAALKHGSTIRMASYCLYFILPERPPNYVPKLFKTPVKRKSAQITSVVPDSSNKRLFSKEKLEKDEDGGDDDEAEPQTDSNTLSKVDLLDRGKTTEELLQVVDGFILKGIFNRTVQHYSSALMLHAVRDICRDERVKIANDNGLSKEKIIACIEASSSYGPWFKFMQSNMKQKSVDSNLTKALLKVGFGKKGSSGRYVQWIIPELKQLDSLKHETSATVDMTIE